MTTEGETFLKKWNEMFDMVHKNPERKGELAELLDEMVDEKVILGAPPYRKPLTGRSFCFVCFLSICLFCFFLTLFLFSILLLQEN